MVFLLYVIGVFVFSSADTTGHDYICDGIPLLRDVSWNKAVNSCRGLNKTLPVEVDSTILKMLHHWNLDSIWLGIQRHETIFSWSDDVQADGVTINPFRIHLKNLKCAFVRMPSGNVYANSCSTKVDGFMCNKKCSDCSEEACIKQNGRCYKTFCGQEMVDWYSAAEFCERNFSGLATEIFTGNGIKGSGNCSEFWIGLTKDRWKADDGYLVHYGWLAGQEDQSHHCVVVSGGGEANRKVSDCTSIGNAICLPKLSIDVCLTENDLNNVTKTSTVMRVQTSYVTTQMLIFGTASLCILLVLVLFVSFSVHLYRHSKGKGVYFLPVIRKRNSSIPVPCPQRPAVHNSLPLSESSPAVCPSNSLHCQEGVCPTCGKTNEDNTFHYENMLKSEDPQCGACGCLVNPQQPGRPRPGLPKVAPGSFVTALQNYTPVASQNRESDYKNIVRGPKTIPVKELPVANPLLAVEPVSSTQPRGAGTKRPNSML